MVADPTWNKSDKKKQIDSKCKIWNIMESVLRLVAINMLEEKINIISWGNTWITPQNQCKINSSIVNKSMWQKLINYSKHNLIYRINFPWNQTQIAHGAKIKSPKVIYELKTNYQTFKLPWHSTSSDWKIKNQ
jgi:hypothetical protein